MKLIEIAEKLLWKIVEKGKARKKNDSFFCYTITGQDGSPYLTRVLFPRALGIRPMLHFIHRPDEDRELHSHPWKFAASFILIGGYTEKRLTGSGVKERSYLPGNLNILSHESWHKITEVYGPTWTLLIAGPRVREPSGTEWQFIDINELIPWKSFIYKKFRNRKDNAPIV